MNAEKLAFALVITNLPNTIHVRVAWQTVRFSKSDSETSVGGMKLLLHVPRQMPNFCFPHYLYMAFRSTLWPQKFLLLIVFVYCRHKSIKLPMHACVKCP